MEPNTFRPRIEDPSGDLDERVEGIARKRGWTVRRAYAKLLENGLNVERETEADHV